VEEMKRKKQGEEYMKIQEEKAERGEAERRGNEGKVRK
jgi:hypothetical protein